MKILVDYKRCEGYGMCEKAAPELFELNESGDLIARFDGREIPPEFEAQGEDAVRLCPVAALTIANGA
jgi:ferredoxin